MSSPEQIQSELSELFCPPLDTTLVAAIAYEPGQTLQSAKEVCETLAAAALAEPQSPSLSPSLHPSRQTQAHGKSATRATKPVGAARRSAFGGKLSSQEAPTSTLPASNRKAAGSNSATASSGSCSSTGSPQTTATDTDADAATVERLLHEWSLVDASLYDRDNLELTDSEPVSDTEPSAEPGHRLLTSASSSGAASKLLQVASDEAARVGHLSGSHHIDPTSIASGRTSLNPRGQEQGKARSETEGVFDPVVFLQHAFPSRTVEFLRETLNDARGDVQTTVDTIMTIDLIETEDARSATVDQLDSNCTASSSRKGGGLDYVALAHGVSAGTHGPGGVEDPHLKGKKRRAARKRLQQEQRLVSNGLAPSADTRNRTNGKVTVNLTDIRQGGASSHLALKKVQQQSAPNSRSASLVPPRTDEELAAELAAEEEEASRDPDAGQPVSDNQWLLTSSILAQLSTLLDVEPDRVTSVYNASSFKLAVCFARLLEQEADRYPSLTSLDEAGNAPGGTAGSIAQGIAAIAGVPPSTAEKALRATKGRQDAALDLLQLQRLVQQEASEADALDPMGRLKELGAAEVPKSVEAAGVRGYAVTAGAGQGKFAPSFPTPSQAASTQSGSSGGSGGDMYSNVIGRRTPVQTPGAAAALRSGSAIASVLPASSSFVAPTAAGDLLNDPIAVERGLASHTSHYDPLRRMTEYRLVAEEYRLRRDEALRKAASAWKSQRGGVRTGGKGGDGGRGGIAWHYADEARRLDAKSRAWSLRASQALVEDRRRAAIGVVQPGTQSTASHTAASNTIDLHGVTVHEALSIVREQVTKWYARPGPGASPPPFKIVTGVGRHSPHQIAVLRPAIAKMLDREGWRYEVDHQRGVITVRGIK